MRLARLAMAQLLVIGLLIWSGPAADAGVLDDGLTWTIVDLHAHQVVHDLNTGLLVASIRATDPNHANEVIAFDPTTLILDWSVAFAVEPDVLAISDDGSYVYVGLGDAHSVAQIETASHSVVATIELPADPYDGLLQAEDIDVAPGNPDLIAVSLQRRGISPGHRGVVAFEDGTQLPNMTSSNAYSDSIEFGDTASILYGQNTHISGHEFTRMSVDSMGVTVDDVTPSFVGQAFEFADGRLYFERGSVADPTIPAVIDRYTTDSTVEAVAPLPSLGFTMAISRTSVPTVDTLTLFDLDGFNVIDELTFNHGQVYGVYRVAPIEGRGIAAVYSEKVVIAGFFPGGDVTGRVTDETTGAPISEVCVYATDDETYIMGETETLDDGTYSMRVPPGDWRILFADCHYVDYFWEWHDNRVLYDLDKAKPVTVNDRATVTVSAELEPSYADSLDSIFQEQIWWMHNTGITTGCAPGAYCPDGTVTRGQMAAFLVRALNLNATSGIDFTDDDTSIFEDNINKLATAGITKGCNPPTNDQFCANDPVTRGQMAAFLVRALGLASASGVDFADTNGSVFKTDINKLATVGITKGCNPPTNDQFCPHQPVTRGQMAAFLFRALETEFTLTEPAGPLGAVKTPAPDSVGYRR